MDNSIAHHIRGMLSIYLTTIQCSDAPTSLTDDNHIRREVIQGSSRSDCGFDLSLGQRMHQSTISLLGIVSLAT